MPGYFLECGNFLIFSLSIHNGSGAGNNEIVPT